MLTGELKLDISIEDHTKKGLHFHFRGLIDGTAQMKKGPFPWVRFSDTAAAVPSVMWAIRSNDVDAKKGAVSHFEPKKSLSH